ncbi:hypothetical protein [Streptomyces sp. EN16]|uniref:hypothetical protein n=1 Tax=Streptomyces sp. EN16 TaxID=212773 RepID=UPI000851D9FD|nr:hypothetical protein [Streptomyces sp. EN16]
MSNDVKVGDRVRIVQEFLHSEGQHVGKAGVLTEFDRGDDTYPYCVLLDGDSDSTWFHRVERLAAPASDREALVTRAKELLDGTPHSVTDIINMANFLAGE